MKLGVFARAFPAASVEENFARVAAAGFAAVQYKLTCAGTEAMPEAIAPDLAARIAAAASAEGIEIAALSGTFNLIHPDPAVRTDGLRRLATLARAARPMGAGLITLCTGTRDPLDMWRAHPDNGAPEAWSDLLAGIAAALEFAERHDVRLGIEPEPGNVVADARLCRRLFDALESPRLGAIFDPGNLIRGKRAEEDRAILTEAAHLLRGRIVLAHAKDALGPGHPVPLGRGGVDFSHWLRELRAADYAGPMILQVDAAAEVPAAAARLRKELDGLARGR